MLDFFDTFFIIVRGKWNQFIFLHYYHHFSIFLVYWLVSNAGNDVRSRGREERAGRPA